MGNTLSLATCRLPLTNGVQYHWNHRVKNVDVNDLDYNGDLTSQMTFPAELHLGTVPYKSVEFRVNGGWVGWSSYRYFVGNISNATVTSQSPEFQFYSMHMVLTIWTC